MCERHDFIGKIHMLTEAAAIARIFSADEREAMEDMARSRCFEATEDMMFLAVKQVDWEWDHGYILGRDQ